MNNSQSDKSYFSDLGQSLRAVNMDITRVYIRLSQDSGVLHNGRNHNK